MAAPKSHKCKTLTLVNTVINAGIAEIDSIRAIKNKRMCTQNFSVSSNRIYQLAASVMKKMFPGTNLIFIVILPHVALMENQIREKLGITDPCRLVLTMLQTYNKDADIWYPAVNQSEHALPAPNH